MSYTVTWKYGDANVIERYFSARRACQKAFLRSKAFAQRHGSCEAEVVDAIGRIHLAHSDSCAF
jgi:hypothetical protein